MPDPASDPTAVLNRLLGLLCRSLPMYLAEARPWVRPGGERFQSLLSGVAADQRLYSARLIDLIAQLRGRPERGSFPMQFTDTHDLSAEHLVRQACQRQRCDLEQIRACVALLAPDTPPRLLAEEILGNAQGHLELLTADC